jgi:hypothetical protein
MLSTYFCHLNLTRTLLFSLGNSIMQENLPWQTTLPNMSDQQDRDAAAPSEQDALLGAESPQQVFTSAHPRQLVARMALSVASIAGSFHLPKAHKGDTSTHLLCAVLLLITASTGFYIIPMTRIVENVLCLQYYREHPLPEGIVGVPILSGPIDEKLCKVESIQAKVAFVFSTIDSVSSVISVLSALPWGIMADR